MSRVMAAGEIRFRRPYRALNLARNSDASAGISSGRSRSGGTQISPRIRTVASVSATSTIALAIARI
jgi:hypothetical protein